MPTSNHSQQPARRKIIAYSILIIGLALSARLIFGDALFSSRSVTINHPSEQTTTLASLEPADNKPLAASTRPIESIRVGDRVLSSNPEISDEERSQWQEPDWNDWLHLTLKMPLSASEGDQDPPILEIEIIRPEQWLIDQVGLVLEPRDEEPIVEPPAEYTADFMVEFDAADGDASVPLSPLRDAYRFLAYAGALAELDDLELIGLTVDIDLPEMGAVGTAFVQDIQPCPPVKSAPGQVVTATFKHPPANQVLDIFFAGESEAIGVTDNHLFWSDDRQAFIAIGEMELGERVVTFHGDTKRIESRLPRPGPQLVYNLEVYGEHVYYVGDQGLLVHNAYSRGKGGDDPGVSTGNVSRYSRDQFEGRNVYRAAEDFGLGVPSNIDPKYVHKSIRQKIAQGWTNADLMRNGNAPIGLDGRPINLHHLLGEEPGPMLEILGSTHKRHHVPLHGLIEDGNSFRNVPGLESQYNSFRSRYWKWRVEQLTSG